MQIPKPWWSQRRTRERLAAAVVDYGARGWPACLGVHPVRDGARACSCDRVGCPAPGAHPIFPSWSLYATSDTQVLRQRWEQYPDANVMLPTGRVFDAFDVPAGAGVIALTRMGRGGMRPGPVVSCGADRYLFFVATRGTPDDEDEWWPSHLDVTKSHTGELDVLDVDPHPELVPDTEGLRWHCRDSYVIAPPSALPSGDHVAWIRSPGRRPLPDPLTLLPSLAEACEEYEVTAAHHRIDSFRHR